MTTDIQKTSKIIRAFHKALPNVDMYDLLERSGSYPHCYYVFTGHQEKLFPHPYQKEWNRLVKAMESYGFRVKLSVSIEPAIRRIGRQSSRSTSIVQRGRIYQRDGYKCLRCGSRVNLTIDHILPISKGGRNVENNKQTLCETCNMDKGDAIADYRKP